MAKIDAKPQPTENEKPIRRGKTRYVFKNASELPPSKPDYVVMSPAPLGQRPVPQLKKQE